MFSCNSSGQKMAMDSVRVLLEHPLLSLIMLISMTIVPCGCGLARSGVRRVKTSKMKCVHCDSWSLLVHVQEASFWVLINGTRSHH